MTPTEIQRVIALFQRHLEKQKKNPNTVRSYTNDLQQFFKWCLSTNGEEFTLQELTRSDIVDFRSFLLTRKSSLASVNRRITALRQFFEFAIEASFARQNPVTGVMGLPNEPQVPSVLTRKDALLLVRTAEQAAWPMESSVLLLLLQAGLRSGEICGLTVGDLHLTPRMGRIFIKGVRKKTMRFVFLSMRAQAALRQYVRKRGVSILARKRRAEALFVHRNGSPLTQQSIDLLVKRIGRDAGIPAVTPTMLRNTYAVQLLLQGEAVDAVKRALGVTSVKSYQRLVEKIQSDAIPF